MKFKAIFILFYLVASAWAEQAADDFSDESEQAFSNTESQNKPDEKVYYF